MPKPQKRNASSIPMAQARGFTRRFDNWELLTSLERHHSEKHRSYSLELSAKLSENMTADFGIQLRYLVMILDFELFLCDFLS